MDNGGWYPDPQGPRGRMRWWDGAGWTDQVAAEGSPETARPPGVTPPRDYPALKHALRRFGPGAGAVIAVVVVLVVVSTLHGGRSKAGPDGPGPSGGISSAPPLAQLCNGTSPSRPGRPVTGGGGPRVVDPRAELSYVHLGRPWKLWDQGTWGQVSGNGLGEKFTTGEYFVTQRATPGGGSYLATVLSGTVPSSYGDDANPNIECAARVIADDVRGLYYPQPNRRKDGDSELLSVSGRAAYVIRFHLAFDLAGYDAKGEEVGICVVDLPNRKVGALYISIPDTHKQYDDVITQVVESLRVLQ